MTHISACIICLNEEDKIGKLLESVHDVADEIVVVDSGSTDKTEEICLGFTQRFIRNEWPGYRQQKQFATDLASHDWVLSLDADEQLSHSLREEILAWKKSTNSGPVAYTVPRLTYFLGGWVRHTTWYPDRQLRLFRKDSGRWTGGRVHESFKVKGEVGHLNSNLLHWTYSSLSDYLDKLDRFSTLSAADYNERGKRAHALAILLYPIHTFLVNFVVRLGFLDGVRGLIVSLLSGVSVLMKYVKLWELQRVRPASR